MQLIFKDLFKTIVGQITDWKRIYLLFLLLAYFYRWENWDVKVVCLQKLINCAQRRLTVSQIHGVFYSLDIILVSLVIWFIYPMERKLEDNITKIRGNNCCKIKELIIKKRRKERKKLQETMSEIPQNEDITHITQSQHSGDIWIQENHPMNVNSPSRFNCIPVYRFQSTLPLSNFLTKL